MQASSSEINELIIEHESKPSDKRAQKTLSRELLAIIHPDEKVAELEQTTYKLFRSIEDLDQKDFENLKDTIPTIKIKYPETIVTILKALGFAESSSEVGRLIKEGCVYCFGQQITDVHHKIEGENVRFQYSLIRKGKKDRGLVWHNY